ncbi:hypothetical protein OC844_000510 [Tilletia horrida]|nr:hypothetical protein OC844_000510 [Tilletia horrida]
MSSASPAPAAVSNGIGLLHTDVGVRSFSGVISSTTTFAYAFAFAFVFLDFTSPPRSSSATALIMPAAKVPITFSVCKELVPFTIGLLALYFIGQPSSPIPTLAGSILRQAHQLSPLPLYAGFASPPSTNAQALAQIRWGASALVNLIVKVHLGEAVLMALYATSKGAGIKEIILWTLAHIPTGFPNYLHFKKVNRAALV